MTDSTPAAATSVAGSSYGSPVHHVADVLYAALQRQNLDADAIDDQRVPELAVVALMAAREAIAHELEAVADTVERTDTDLRQRGWRDGLLHGASVARGGKSGPQLSDDLAAEIASYGSSGYVVMGRPGV